jgi:lysophospholipase L1-like esterase
MQTLRAWTLLILLACASALHADLLPLKTGQKIVFLGDSITQGGTWVEYVDFIFRTRFPDAKVEVIPLGLSSETVCGLTEEGHPFPRPNVHDRLESILDKTEPDVVVACYGMNDGNYKELSPERFKAYQDGIRLLVKRCESRGVRPVLLTPPPFDPVAKPDKLVPAGKWEPGKWYDHYDQVLATYAKWELNEFTRKGYVVGDANGRTQRFLDEVRRNGDPKFVLAKDAIHPGPLGHWLMAEALVSAWTISPEVKLVFEATKGDEWIFTSQIPLPPDARWGRPVNLRLMDDYSVSGTIPATEKTQHFIIKEGQTVLGEATRTELDAGLDLTRFDKLSTVQRGAEMMKLIQKMHAILRPAWLSYCGHTRPGVKPGLPIEEAKKQAAEIDKQLRELAKPVKITLTLQPAQ